MLETDRLKERGNVPAETERHGLTRGQNGLAVYMMCEIPSNVILMEECAEIFDGFSIGSNDLTQLVVGVDRGASVRRAERGGQEDGGSASTACP